MRRVVVGGLLLLLGLFRIAFASNVTYYDLTIDPAAKSLLKDHSLTIYQPFGLVKPGDKIVSITVGKLPNPNIKCQIYAGVGDGSTVLDAKGTLPGFGGEIRLGQGNPGSSAATAALLEHVLPPPLPDKRSSFVQSTGAYLADHPAIWVGFGVILLLSVIVALMRLNSTPAGQAPIYGKRAYEENIREVKEKLERIMESQEFLVRKPPVLRTFRKQIDRFDKRLEKLEVTSVSTQQALSVLATSLVDLKEFLEGLSARNEDTKKTVEDVRTSLAGQVADTRNSVQSLREEFRSHSTQLDGSIQALDSRVTAQAEQVSGLGTALREDIKSGVAEASQAAKTLSGQIAAQNEESKVREKGIAAEFERIQAKLGESQNQLNQLRSEFAAQQQSASSSLGQLEQKLAGAFEQIHSGMASQDKATAEHIAELQNSFAEVIAQVQTTLANQEQATEEKFAEIRQGFGGVNEQLEGLTPLPANVSELHGRVGNIKVDIGNLAEQLGQYAAQMDEAQRSSVVSFAGMEGKVAEIKDVIAELGSELGKLQSEMEVQRSLVEAGSNTIAEVSKQIEEVKEGVPTKAQLSQLERVPGSVQSIHESVSGFAQKLAEVGLSKDDAKKILNAHEKLGSLSGEISETLQKALEQKLTAILAQSLATKKGKESEGSGISDRGAAALSQVAQQLLAEIDHQKNLEQTLTGVMAKIDALPAALQKIDEKLLLPATPGESAAGIPVDHLLSMIAETKLAVESLPEKISSLEKGLEDVAGKWVETDKKIDSSLQHSAATWAQANQKIEESLAETAAKWSEANGKLQDMAGQIADLASAPPKLVVPAAPASQPTPVQAQVEQPTPKQAESEKPAKKELKAEPTVVEEPEEPLVLLETATSHDLPDEIEEQAPMPVLEIVEESAPEAPAQPQKATARARKPQAPLPAGAEDWSTATGDLGATWTTRSTRSYHLNSDGEAVKRALTPTETPGIEYQIGPMLCTQNRVVYAHGDSLRAFWPGGNERSILLSYSVPDESWRLLLTQLKIFCVEEKRVEIIDTNSWSKSAHFTGEYSGQSVCGDLWAGLRAGSNPVIEFRDMAGDISGKAVDLDRSFSESLPLVSGGDHIFVAAQNGKVFRADPSGGELFSDFSGGKNSLLHFLLTDFGAVAVVSEPAGVSIKLLDESGKVQKSVVTDAKQTSGNVVAVSDRLYFFDPDRQELNICDLDGMTMENGLELPNVQRIRKMAGFGMPNSEVLMIASCDPAGKLGSVFLLEPESGTQLGLCSTNQPHVDAIFGAGHAIVATSSSYQNIIRVFKPFVGMEGEKAA